MAKHRNPQLPELREPGGLTRYQELGLLVKGKDPALSCDGGRVFGLSVKPTGAMDVATGRSLRTFEGQDVQLRIEGPGSTESFPRRSTSGVSAQ